eukprot:TRINITY_DN15058_c0_g1_i1.p2 TRINITY_DN15058_c0_g1~~TRINITY_DN15058_c0_g1_i1.p2  ORF type:complete len:105 (+),score=39.66 TRINITY_DN15058_c0_g1_i1:151-465(+)
MKRREDSKESGIIAVDLASDDEALFVPGTFVDPFPDGTVGVVDGLVVGVVVAGGVVVLGTVAAGVAGEAGVSVGEGPGEAEGETALHWLRGGVLTLQAPGRASA